MKSYTEKHHIGVQQNALNMDEKLYIISNF